MKRRQFLSGLAVVPVTATAGCMGVDVPFVGGSSEQPSIDGQVRILDHDMLAYPTDDGTEEFIDVIGEAVNTTEETIPTVVIFVEVFDASHQPLTYEFESYTEISPREIWDFEVPIFMPEDGDLANEADSYTISIYDDARSADTSKDYKY
mgnify:CR=1 FL=1